MKYNFLFLVAIFSLLCVSKIKKILFLKKLFVRLAIIFEQITLFYFCVDQTEAKNDFKKMKISYKNNNV
jgi:hypothetical protein